MASENNLTAVFTDIANAIRDKKGTTDTIKPINMADEVLSIRGGFDKYIDPIEYRKEHRPKDWPYVRLPSEIEREENPTEVAIHTFIELLILEKEVYNSDPISIWVSNTKSYNLYATVDWGDGTPIETITNVTDPNDYINYTSDLQITHTINWENCQYCESEGCRATVIKIKVPKRSFTFGFSCNPSEISATMDYLVADNSYNATYNFKCKRFSNSTENATSSYTDLSMYSDICRFISFKEFTNCMTTYYPFTSRRNLECVCELDCSKVTYTPSYLFGYNNNLVSIPELHFDNLSSISPSYGWFYSCPSLLSLPTMSFNKATTISKLFYQTYITSIPLIKAPLCKILTNLFESNTSLIFGNLDLTYMPLVTNLSYLFSSCSKLTNINIINCPENITNTSYMFSGCSRLTTIEGLNYKNITIAKYMFNGCYNLVKLNIKENITNLEQVDSNFCYNCYRLDVDNELLKHIDHSDVSFSINNAFSLTPFPKESFERLPINLINCTNMFSKGVPANKIIEVDCSNRTTLAYALEFGNSSSNSTGYNTANSLYKNIIIKCINTDNITSISYMFYGISPKEFYMDNASKLTNASNFIYNSSTNMSNLQKISLPGLSISLTLSNASNLSKEGLVSLFNDLAPVTSTKTLSIGPTNLNKLSAEEKAIATNKGWTLA